MHEGEALKNAAKTSQIGVTGLADALGIPRSSFYYQLKDETLEEDLKKKSLKVLGLKSEQVFKEVEGVQEPAQAYKPFREAFDLGSWNENDPKEEHRGKRFIDLGNGNYRIDTPLVPHIATMGYLSGYADQHWLDELPPHSITVTHIPHGDYRTFIARGLSMFDGTARSIFENSKVTGRVINQELYRHSKLHLHKFSLFIIVHKEGIMIKEITKHDVENGIITVHSYNPDKKEYPDIDIDLKDVLQLLNVIKIERDI